PPTHTAPPSLHDALPILELDAAPEAAVGEDRHGHRLHVVAVQRLPLIPAESADGAALPEGRVAGGIAAAGNETDHKAREHAFHRSEEHTSELQSRVELVC